MISFITPQLTQEDFNIGMSKIKGCKTKFNVDPQWHSVWNTIPTLNLFMAFISAFKD